MEKNVTLISQKNQFRTEKIVFMGLLLSKYGICLIEEKVRAVLETNRPSKPTEVRRFLGVVLSASFVPTLQLLKRLFERSPGNKSPMYGVVTKECFFFHELKQQLASASVLA